MLAFHHNIFTLAFPEPLGQFVIDNAVYKRPIKLNEDIFYLNQAYYVDTTTFTVVIYKVINNQVNRFA